MSGSNSRAGRSAVDAAGLTTVRTVGGLIPADLLARIIAGTDLAGLSADDYHLELGVTPREAANRAWSVLTGAWKAYRTALAPRPSAPAGTALAARPSAPAGTVDRATGLTRDKWLAVLLRELGFGRVPSTPAGGVTSDGRSFPVSHLYRDVPIHLLGWGVDLDRRTPGVPGAAERAPHAMVQELLNRSDAYLWALVANGGTLRLLRDSSSLVGQSYVEFDLEAMFDGEVFSDFAVLYLLCHVTRFEPAALDAEGSEAGLGDCWLERWRTDAVETGARALGALRIGVKLAIEALGTGFLQHPANSALRQRLEPGGDLTLADYHRGLLRLVYRLLFCFVAEDRGLLLDPAADVATKARYAQWFSTARLRRIGLRRRGTHHGDLWPALSLVIDGLGAEGGRPELGLPGIGGLFEPGPADVVTGAQAANQVAASPVQLSNSPVQLSNSPVQLSNRHLLTAIRHLCVVQPPGGGPKRTVDYRNLGAEELGGIYESLLELVARYDPAGRSFTLEALGGNERKTTGAYYTPTSLIDCLLDSALDPLLDEAERATDPAAELLALTVCDPACGSGHFLVAAARRIAARLARVRGGDAGAEPTLVDAQRAMADVVANCIYGVDLNPMAAELAKVSLWLEALEPGRPLGFLDSHIKVGNALLGTTPALLAQGIPDDAFTALDGDDKKTVLSLRKRNKVERSGQGDFFTGTGIRVDNRAFAAEARAIDSYSRLSLVDIHLAQQRQRRLDESPELRRDKLVANAWCTAFVVAKRPGSPAITTAVLEHWQTSPHWQSSPHPPSGVLAPAEVTATPDDQSPRPEVERLAASYRFFHWHLEFPKIFAVPDGGPALAFPLQSAPTGWQGGFSCVVGNPPWERIKLAEQEFFAAKDPIIAGAANAAARKKLIKTLADEHPALFAEFEAAKRQADGESHLIRSSGRFPLCGRGDVNTYAVFAETDRSLVADRGRLGVILPTGIATDATTQHFFKDLVLKRSLASLYDFENAKPLFEGVHRSFKFCLLTVAGPGRPVDAADFAFFAHQVTDLDRPDARFRLTPEEITRLNPNTGTCPVFRSRRDAEITLGIYRRVPVLIRHGGSHRGQSVGDAPSNPWGLSFMRMIDMSNDSHLFRTAADLEADALEGGPWTAEGNHYVRGAERMLPLYEAKMIHHYDHRWATYGPDGKVRDVTPAEHDDPHFVVQPRYWVPATDVDAKLADRWKPNWLLGFRDIARSTDERTMIAGTFPKSGVGNKLPLFVSVNADDCWALSVALSSLAVDFAARQKLGGTTMNFFIAEQLPVPPPSAFAAAAPWAPDVTVADWIRPRVLELTYTEWTLEPFAADLGDTGPPFRWDDARRAGLRAELDGAFFHLYGIDRDDAAYILSTFPIVTRNDMKAHGEPRTTRLVLAAYDRLAAAITTSSEPSAPKPFGGAPFVSTLTPPPGQGPRHPPR